MRGRRRYEDEPPPAKASGQAGTAELAAKWRGPAPAKPGYREQSLRLHGLICAKCAREFAPRDSHLLTVHHKDGNYKNNPPDGSNWENLCVYCHDDEHSRGL
ncbi:MAG: HNH nuclease family protein [Desulfarculus sp.]|nr:HNH nuclease family protein [Desulfarculus sp.]